MDQKYLNGIRATIEETSPGRHSVRVNDGYTITLPFTGTEGEAKAFRQGINLGIQLALNSDPKDVGVLGGSIKIAPGADNES